MLNKQLRLHSACAWQPAAIDGGPDAENQKPGLQELNDRRLTLVEGSALSERDLVRTNAHASSAILLLADRFSPSSHQEDLGLQFQARSGLNC